MESKDGMTPQGGANANNINNGPTPANVNAAGSSAAPAPGGVPIPGGAPIPSSTMGAVPTAAPASPAANPGTSTNSMAGPGIPSKPAAPAPGAPMTPPTPQATPTAPGAPNVAGAPNAAAQPATDKPKKKTALIAGIAGGVVALLAVIIVGVVVAINLNADPVKAAFNKIMTNGLPANVKLNGTIDFAPATSASDESDSASINCDVNVNGEIELATLKNAMTLGVTCDSADETNELSNVLGNLDLTIEERNVDSTLYVKVDGIKGLFTGGMTGTDTDEADEADEMDEAVMYEDEEYLNEMDMSDETMYYSTDDSDLSTGLGISSGLSGGSSSSTSLDGSMMMLGILGMFGSVFDEIDGQWIEVGDAQLDQGLESNCTVKFFMNIKNKGKEFAEVYNANPFIVSSKDDVKVKSKKNTVYGLTIDREKYASFISAADSAGLLSEYRSCLSDNHQTDMINDFPKMLEDTYKPTVYVEVNDDKDFSRVYFTMTNDQQGTYTVDLELAYPASIQVEAPEDATDFQTLLQSAMSGMMGGGMMYQNGDYGSYSTDSDYGYEYNYDDYDYEYDY